MKDVKGQISLFDMWNQLGKTLSEPPVLLHDGQKLYVVIKGDVKKARVTGESWVCEENNRGYRLEFENGAYGCTWNNRMDKDVFLVEGNAVTKAEEYLKNHEVIRAEEICPVRTVAYQYIRDIDNHIMTAFYSELDNGMIYMKKFITFHHIVEANKKEKAIKEFMQQDEFKYEAVEEVKYEPVFKNMYRIRQKYDWDYAEAGHSYAIG